MDAGVRSEASLTSYARGEAIFGYNLMSKATETGCAIDRVDVSSAKFSAEHGEDACATTHVQQHLVLQTPTATSHPKSTII